MDNFLANVKAIPYVRVMRSDKTLQYSGRFDLSRFRLNQSESSQNIEEQNRITPQYPFAHEISDYEKQISFTNSQKSEMNIQGRLIRYSREQYSGADPFCRKRGANQLD